MILLLFSIFTLVFATSDAPNQTNIKAYNEQLDQIFLHKNSGLILESINKLAKVLLVFGDDVSEAIAAGIKTDVKDLKPESAAAFILAFNHSIHKLNAIENIVVELGKDINIPLVDAQLADLSVQLSHFTMLYQRSDKFHDKTLGAESLRDACKRYDPQLNLGILKFNTMCSPISDLQMETYLSGILQFQELEGGIDFNSVSLYETRKYESLKQKALMIFLESPDSRELLKNLKSKSYNLNGDIDQLTRKLEHDIWFENSNAYWLKLAFDAFKGNRRSMENFLNVILYKTLQGIEQSLVCASITANGNPGAVRQYLIDTQYLVLNITANIERFLNDIERHIYPKFITNKIRSILLTTTVEPANMNATAQRIADEIMAIDDSKKFHYHVLLTDLTTDNYGSKYQCKSGYSCLDITENNIRLISVRFDIGINMCEHVEDGTTLLLGHLSAWKKWVKKSSIQDTLDHFSHKFFPLTFNAFTIIILHNKQQFSSAAVINFGMNHLAYQGINTSYAIDHFIDYQWPYKDHVIKIIFLIH